MSKDIRPEIVWEDEESTEDGADGGSQEFAQLLSDGGGERGDDFQVGDKVQGTIVLIDPKSKDVIVDIGAKGTAIISKEELESEANRHYEAGSTLEAVVISRRGGEIVLSRSMAKGLQASADLKQAYAARIPVKGKVTGENKGGFDVAIFGKKAFCPVSQMDRNFVEDKSTYIGKEFQFLITSYKGDRDIAVSRRQLLDAEAASHLKHLLDNLDKNNTFEGQVTRLEKFGAFVDIGSGVEGLVHISEISHGRLNHTDEVLQKGDKVRVKVLEAKKDAEGRTKLSLSMRALADDPWDHIAENFRVGGKFEGKVVSLMNFGAFVELAKGIEGLIHISEMSWTKRVNHPKEVLQIGDKVQVNILTINSTTKQMALSLKDIEDDPWQRAKDQFKAGGTYKGKVESMKGFGALVALAEGVEGLLPVSTMKRAQGEAFRKHFSPPKEIEVKIANFDSDHKKILLTLPNLEDEDQDTKDYQEYLKEQSQRQAETKTRMPSGESLGSFGELLKRSIDRGDSK